MILGAFVQGVSVTGRTFSGGAFDWLNAFSVMTGVALVAGYALLGATWLIMKTEDVTQEWARKCTGYLFWHVALFMGLVSLCMPIMDTRIRELWFDPVNFHFPQCHAGLVHCPVLDAVAGSSQQK